MKYDKRNWTHELALKHCLSDPRIDKELRAQLKQFVASFYMEKNPEKVSMNETLTKDDVIIFYKQELPVQELSCIAIEDKQAIKTIVKSHYTNLESQIKKKI